MTVLLAVATIVLALAITVNVLTDVARRRRPAGWLEERTTERLIVHTTDGQTVEGSTREVAADGVVLAAVRLVDHELDLAGDVWIPRAKISLVQRAT